MQLLTLQPSSLNEIISRSIGPLQNSRPFLSRSHLPINFCNRNLPHARAVRYKITAAIIIPHREISPGMLQRERGSCYFPTIINSSWSPSIIPVINHHHSSFQTSSRVDVDVAMYTGEYTREECIHCSVLSV